MLKQISQKAKILYEKWLVQRDGLTCLYCKKDIPKNQKHVHDHLNDNRGDNRLENYARAHQSCNIAKISTFDYQIMAQEKLKENESALFIPVEDNTSDEASTEINISKNSFDITEQYISEKIVLNEKISWDDALYGSVYKCKRLTGYGSVQSVRSYLKTLSSPEAPFMQTKDKNKKKIIVKRSGN